VLLDLAPGIIILLFELVENFLNVLLDEVYPEFIEGLEE